MPILVLNPRLQLKFCNSVLNSKFNQKRKKLLKGLIETLNYFTGGHTVITLSLYIYILLDGSTWYVNKLFILHRY